MSGSNWRATVRRQLIDAARCLEAAQSTAANAADSEPVPFELADSIAEALNEIRAAMTEAQS